MSVPLGFEYKAIFIVDIETVSFQVALGVYESSHCAMFPSFSFALLIDEKFGVGRDGPIEKAFGY